MSNKARQSYTVGEIVNMVSTDAQRLLDLTVTFYNAYSAPLQITLALGLLYMFIGPAVFAGFAVMLLLVPLNFLAARRGKHYQVRQQILDV